MEDLFSKPREVIVNLITKNIINPDTNKLFTLNSIYDRQPDLKSINFNDFPYIIVEFPQIDISTSDDFATQDMKIRRYEWDFDITVHATERATGINRNLKGGEFTAKIADQLIAMFDNSDVRKHLQSHNLFFGKPDISSITPVNRISNTLVYEFSMSLTFTNHGNMQSNKMYKF